jgi:pimeloyl-ACP methyl ester carboxylesterase
MQAHTREHIRAVTRDVNARGARIRFVEAGEGPTLLLVHGFLASHVTWEDALEALATRFHVVVPDLPGFGESEKPSHSRYRYTFDAFAESLIDLGAALGLTRFSVCGHALGGSIALVMAADHPDVVDRLVLVSPVVYAQNVNALDRIALQPLVGPLLFKQLYGARFFRSHFQRHTPQANGERLAYLYDVFNPPAAREAAYATMSSMNDTRPLVARLSRITAPTMVLWGRHDRHNPIDHGRRLVREIRGARLDVFECGHAPPEECPTPFVEAVTSFVGQPRTARERGTNGKVA